jgi:succinate dehydrogenase/fumarate reductase-like Fe-S protein
MDVACRILAQLCTNHSPANEFMLPTVLLRAIKINEKKAESKEKKKCYRVELLTNQEGLE